MKLNLNFKIKDLEGNEIEEKDAHAGKILGNHLVSGSKGDALKYYDWGRTLYKGEGIEVDRSDLDKIKQFVEENATIPILTKAQIIEVINKCE